MPVLTCADELAHESGHGGEGEEGMRLGARMWQQVLALTPEGPWQQGLGSWHLWLSPVWGVHR